MTRSVVIRRRKALKGIHVEVCRFGRPVEAFGIYIWSGVAMRMSIFAFALLVALAAGSAYSEMIAMNDSPGSISGMSDVPIDQENKGAQYVQQVNE